VSATLKFRITDGPFAADYDIDPNDFTGTEINRFRQAVGMSLDAGLSMGANGVDLDVMCGCVWLVRSRQNKGLAFAAVADNVTRGSFKPLTDDDPPLANAEGAPDPTSSAAG
jgi:hypothetical protein